MFYYYFKLHINHQHINHCIFSKYSVSFYRFELKAKSAMRLFSKKFSLTSLTKKRIKYDNSYGAFLDRIGIHGLIFALDASLHPFLRVFFGCVVTVSTILCVWGIYLVWDFAKRSAILVTYSTQMMQTTEVSIQLFVVFIFFNQNCSIPVVFLQFLCS